jgi:hypothetical protein
MSRTIEELNAEKTIKIATQVRMMQIAEDLYLYREENKVVHAQDKEGGSLKTGARGETNYQFEGFIDGAGRQALAEGKIPERLQLFIVGSELLERLRTKGFHRDGVDEDLYALKEQKPWEMFQADLSLSADNLVRIDYGNHMVFDYTGAPKPAALLFDYISNGISESTHDLQKLAAYLMKRSDIEVYEDILGHRVSLAENVREAVYQIPSYNADKGREESVQFSWMPTKEEYVRACELVGGDDKVYPSKIKTAVLTNDLLGISQFQLSSPRRRHSM